MPRMMKTTAFIAVLSTTCFILLYQRFCIGAFLSLAVTFGTISYHFLMRLIVGMLYNVFMRNQADYNRRWYHVGKTEMKLYQLLQVKRWKRFMPTYDRDVFDPRKHSWDEIAQAMCQSELVHETIIPLSFLPIFGGIWFDSWAVFIVTSVIAAMIDLVFVIMQRYNRPRILRLIHR